MIFSQVMQLLAQYCRLPLPELANKMHSLDNIWTQKANFKFKFFLFSPWFAVNTMACLPVSFLQFPFLYCASYAL